MQVKETALLAQNTARQATATEELAFANKSANEQERLREHVRAQPLLLAQGGTQSGNAINTKVVNKGGRIREVEVTCETDHALNLTPTQIWESGQEGKLQIVAAHGQAVEFPIDFVVSYVDSFGNRHEKTFSYVGVHDLREIGADSGNAK